MLFFFLFFFLRETCYKLKIISLYTDGLFHRAWYVLKNHGLENKILYFSYPEVFFFILANSVDSCFQLTKGLKIIMRAKLKLQCLQYLYFFSISVCRINLV